MSIKMEAGRPEDFERVYIVERVVDKELKLPKWIVIDMRTITRVKHFWTQHEAVLFADEKNNTLRLTKARKYREYIGQSWLPCLACVEVMKVECSILQWCCKQKGYSIDG
jgi:hypothetical protein